MKTKMLLAEAEEKAQAIVRFIEPWCERVEIAGSIRRRRPEVGTRLVIRSKTRSHYR